MSVRGALKGVVFIFTAAAAIYLAGCGAQKESVFIEATGTVEATEVELSPKLSERITWLCCRVGERVEKGSTAFRLDDRELKARVEGAKATLRAAEEAVKEARVDLEDARGLVESARYELEAAGADVKRQEALAADASLDLKRARELIEKGFIPRKEFDSARASFDAATALLNSYEARRRVDEAKLRNARTRVRLATTRINTALAKKKEAGAALKVLLTELQETAVSSPLDGVVSYKAFEAGELPSAGESVYTVYDPDDIWARVDVPESRIEGVRLGARVVVSVPGAPQKHFEALVSEISELGEFATHKDVVRETHDIKTFRVKARIVKPAGLLKPGMTVDVKISRGNAATAAKSSGK